MEELYTKAKLFGEDKPIRCVWHDEEWYYSIQDVVEVLTNTFDPVARINWIKTRDKILAAKWREISTLLVMPTKREENRRIMMANTLGILRFLMAMDHYSADPYKMWLACNARDELYADSWDNKPRIFAEPTIRSVWHGDDWYYSIQDVVAAYANTRDPAAYLHSLRQEHRELDAMWSTICQPMVMADQMGTKRRIMAANTAHTYLLLIYFHSRQAEPIKMWMCRAASDALYVPYATVVLQRLLRVEPLVYH